MSSLLIKCYAFVWGKQMDVMPDQLHPSVLPYPKYDITRSNVSSQQTISEVGRTKRIPVDRRRELLSEVAQIKQRITDEYLAAKNGLTGLAAGISTHQFITHKMENMGKYQAELAIMVGQEQAAQIMNEVLASL
jgi:hypothetical protein